MSEFSQSLIVTHTDIGQRLDRFVAQQLPDLSRSRIQQLITEGQLTKSGDSITDCSYRVKSGDSFDLNIPPPVTSCMKATNIPINVIFEDEHLLVIFKPAGLTVHPGAGNYQDTLANGLLYHFKDSLSGIGGVERPGIVHRLDKETSGLMIVAKHDRAHLKLSEMISKRKVKRHYLALCWGVPHPLHGTINEPIGRHSQNRVKMAVTKKNSREAITHYSVQSIFGKNTASLIECRLETGRTHQIRVHLAHLLHPLIGDPLYGQRHHKKLADTTSPLYTFLSSFHRQALHAHYLAFTHPITHEAMEYQIDMPKDMQALLTLLQALSSS